MFDLTIPMIWISSAKHSVNAHKWISILTKCSKLQQRPCDIVDLDNVPEKLPDLDVPRKVDDEVIYSNGCGITGVTGCANDSYSEGTVYQSTIS